MKFHIRNLVLLGVMALPVCAAPKKKVAVKPSSSGVLVFQRGKKLAAVRLGSETPFVLRESFLFDTNYNIQNSDWKLSPDGRRVAFAQFPRDVDFFSAASWRSYVWTTAFNQKARVLLASYGRRATKRDYSFFDPIWSANSQRLAVSQHIIGNYTEAGEVAVYDAPTRREVWSSRFIKSKFLPVRAGFWITFSNPALSPDGTQLVCIAREEPGDGTSLELPDGQKAAPTSVVLFDIKRGRGKLLASVDDQFSVGRYHFKDNSQYSENPVRPWRPQFIWHPTQKKFLFVGPTSPTNPAVNLFALDLQTRQMSRLTNSAQDDFSPQWSPDGKSLFWIRGDADPRRAINNQIFRADASGSNPTPMLPQIKGVTRIQLLPKIADWSRYRKLSIEPLAGKDK